MADVIFFWRDNMVRTIVYHLPDHNTHPVDVSKKASEIICSIHNDLDKVSGVLKAPTYLIKNGEVSISTMYVFSNSTSQIIQAPVNCSERPEYLKVMCGGKMPCKIMFGEHNYCEILTLEEIKSFSCDYVKQQYSGHLCFHWSSEDIDRFSCRIDVCPSGSELKVSMMYDENDLELYKEPYFQKTILVCESLGLVEK